MNDTIGVNPGDFAVLDDGVYTMYFRTLLNAFKRLLLVQDASEDTQEAQTVKSFVSRLLFTIEALRMKFTYSPVHNRDMWIDLSTSGFPNREVIASLETDLRTREERLQRLLPGQLLRAKVLDHMFAQHEEPGELLWQLADRTYFEMIDQDKLFLAFTPGELVRRRKSRESGCVRQYSYSWGCYDFSTNRPYVHVMYFDQDTEDEPLERDNAALIQFLHVVKSAGSRASEIGNIALVIDDALTHIHPKTLKRVCIGPLYSPLLIRGRTEFSDECEAAACALLAKYEKQPDDSVLFFTDEIVFSRQQRHVRTLFGKRVREIFDIDNTGSIAQERRASLVHRSVIMPHVIAQHIQSEEGTGLDLKDVRVVTYDEKGDVHGT